MRRKAGDNNMENILTIPNRPVIYKKFVRLMIITTLLMVGTFGSLYYLRRSVPMLNSVAPGRLGAPVFSHYIYGGFGDEALNKPMFATLANGRAYVSDTNNHRVQVFSEAGDFLFRFGERGSGQGEFFYPYGIVVGPDGSIYVADMYRNDIQVFTAEGEYLRDFLADSEARELLSGPGGMHLDDSGRLFVANVNRGNVEVFDLAQEEHVMTVGIPGDVFAPNAVTVDNDGYIYVSDTGGERVVVYNPDGTRPVRVINGSTEGYGQSVLSNPRGVGVRGDWIFVVSNMSHSVHVFDKEGKEIFSFGKQGDRQDEFMHPNGVFVDRRGRLLITDSIGGRIAVYR